MLQDEGSQSELKYTALAPADLSCADSGSEIFFAAIRSTRMPMTVTNPQLVGNPIVFCNEAFQELSGYSFSEIHGRNCRFLQGPKTNPVTVAEIRTAIAERRVITTEILNYRKDGTTFWNSLFISPVFDTNGKLVYFFGSQLDVTRRHEAEDALAQSQKMEAIGQLTGGLAHDFNNLLQVIVGYTEELKILGDTVEPRFLTSAVAAISIAAERGTKLTQQLLAFARKQRLDGRVVQLNNLVRNLTPLIERTVGGTISVEKHFDENLALAKIDTTQAELAILNLLINARDAMPDGGRITIETANRAIEREDLQQFCELTSGNYVVLSITDSGVGIAPHILKRVTEPFFTTKEQGKGTGLGLSMVYGFAKQSGGALRIYSEPGIGTTVRLFFPALDGSSETLVQSARERTFTTSHEKLLGASVLIVEDQADVGDFVECVVQSLGCETFRASNAAQALELLRRGVKVDLLFTDLVMPGGMNGISLATEFRRLQPQAKVLLTTGYSEMSLSSGCAEAIEFPLLSKPYKRSELTDHICQLLKTSSSIS